MSNSTPCNLEEVMRGLSISSPDEQGSRGPSLNRQENQTLSDQRADDEVFVHGGVAEERGEGDALDQREQLDTTDALLLDATNKMDDTAFLDEVIARNCRSFGSTDDDYIDEVIARSIKRSMENLLDGDYGDLDGTTRYMDEVISRSEQFKQEDNQPLLKTSCQAQRQQICDNVVKRYLTAVKDSPTPLLGKRATTPQNRPMIGKVKSPFLTPAQPNFSRAPTAAKDKKANVVNVLQKQREGQLKDWRTMLHQKKEEQKMPNNSEEQLKDCKADLVKKDLELEEVNRKLTSALAAKETLEVKLEDMKLQHESNKESLGFREEEVRVRNSDITRLDLEVSAKEKMLEEVSNAAIEAEKTIFGYELSVKSLEGKLLHLENENDGLRKELSNKRADLEGQCLANEELVRKLVVEEKHAQAAEKELVRTAEELKTAKVKVEETEWKSFELQMKVDSRLAEAAKVEEGTKFEAERKEDFANAKAKFDVKAKSCELQEQSAEKCPECETWKLKVEDLEDVVRKSNVDLETCKDELERLQRKEMTFKDEIEVMVDARTSLQAQVKTSQDMVTGQEVKLRGAEALASLLEEKLEATEARLKVASVELDTTNLTLEEESRRRRALQAKVEQYEDKEEKNVDQMRKIEEDFEAKCQEVAQLKQGLSITEVDLKEAVDIVETLKKSFEDKNDDLDQAKLKCDEHKMMGSLREAKLVQLEDENDALKQRIEESQARLEGLEKDQQVKMLAAEKLVQDLETEKQRQMEYKQEMEEAIKAILALL